MPIFNNKSSLIKLAGFITPDMAAKGTPGSGYSVGTLGWRKYDIPTYNVTGTKKLYQAEGSTNFNSNYNNPSISNFNRFTYTKGQANNKANAVLQSLNLPIHQGIRNELGMSTGDNSQLSIVDTAEMMHKIHPKSYPTVEHARRFRDEYINPGRALNQDSYLKPVPKLVALFQDPESTIGPAALMSAPNTYDPEYTAFINVPSPNAADPFSKLKELLDDKIITLAEEQPRPHLTDAVIRDLGLGGRGLDKNSIKLMLLSDTGGTPHEMHHVGNAVNTEALDKSNNKFFLPKWHGGAYGLTQLMRVAPSGSLLYKFLPYMTLPKLGRSLFSYNPRFYDTYLSIPNEHTLTLSLLRHYGKGIGIDTFTRDPNAIRLKYADSFAHLVSNKDLSINLEDRRLLNYADSLLYREAMRNYLNTPHTAQRPTIFPEYNYALKDPSAIYRLQTIDFNRKNPEQVQKEALRFLEPWNNNTLLYTY